MMYSVVISKLVQHLELILTRSSDSSFVCFSAPALPPAADAADAADGCGAFGSHVTRLHGTPWRAQFEHGFSSSHYVI